MLTETMIINPQKKKLIKKKGKKMPAKTTTKRTTHRRRRNPQKFELMPSLLYAFIGLVGTTLIQKNINIKPKYAIGAGGAILTSLFGKKFFKNAAIPLATGMGIASLMEILSMTEIGKSVFSDYCMGRNLPILKNYDYGNQLENTQTIDDYFQIPYGSITEREMNL